MTDAYSHILDTLLLNIQDHTISSLIRIQLECLQRKPAHIPRMATLNLPHDRYYALSILTNYLEPRQKGKYPYFFLTGPAGTGKSFMIEVIKNLLKARKSCFRILASTGVAAQNIGGATIHSQMRIRSTENGFSTLIFYDVALKEDWSQVDT